MTQRHTHPEEPGVPVACSLAADQLEERVASWNDALAYVTARRELPGGVQLVFQEREGLVEDLTALARLEHDCCPWMELAVSDPPPTLTVTAAGAGVAAARRMFAGDG